MSSLHPHEVPAARRGTGAAVTASTLATAGAGWLAVTTLGGERAVPWVVARASGLTSYVLLVVLVGTGLALAHPWSRRLRWLAPDTRLSLHASLATFTLSFTALHVVVLATDPWADVGWSGALLPLASGYRPVAVTLGVLALWAGLVTGVSARLAGRVAARVWWPVHKVAAGTLVLVWAHAVLAGSDSGALVGFYVLTGLGVLLLALTRYGASTARDRVTRLTRTFPATAPSSTPVRRPARTGAARPAATDLPSTRTTDETS